MGHDNSRAGKGRGAGVKWQPGNTLPDPDRGLFRTVRYPGANCFTSACFNSDGGHPQVTRGAPASVHGRSIPDRRAKRPFHPRSQARPQ